jgi:hypothetical protein
MIRSERIPFRHDVPSRIYSMHTSTSCPVHKCKADDSDDCDDSIDDGDDNSFELEDLIPGGNREKHVPVCHRDGGNEDVDEDSSIESSLREDDEHDRDDLDDDAFNDGDMESGAPLPPSLNRIIQEVLNVQHLSASKIRHREGRGKKAQSLNASSGSLYNDDDHNNRCAMNDESSVFNLSSSCLSYDHDEDNDDNYYSPNRCLNGALDGAKKVEGVGLLLLTPVRFSAGKNLHQHQSFRRGAYSSGSNARAALPMTPMSRITEHTRESACNTGDVEGFSTSSPGHPNSNNRRAGRRSSIATSANNSIVEDASSKMSNRSIRRLEICLQTPPMCGGANLATTATRCEILNMQDLPSLLMLSLDD